MQHLDEGTIHAWLDGALSSDESSRVEQHARQCAECAAMVADARGLIAGAARVVSALDVVPGGVIPRARAATPAASPLWRKLRLSPFRAALAASVLVAVASMFAVRRVDQKIGGPPAMERVVVAPMAAPADAAAPGPTTQLASERDVAGARAVEARAAATKPSARQLAKVANEAPAATDTTRRMADAIVAAPAAAPPPVVSLEQSRRQAPDSLAAKMAAAPVAPAQGQSQAQSFAGAAAGRGGSGAADIAARREFSRTLQLSEVVTTSAVVTTDFAGCYQVANDSANWPRTLPSRFALTAETTSVANLPRNVVRGVDRGGRIDSTVVGDWRSVSATNATVSLTGGGDRAVFTLTQGSPATMSQVAAGAETKPVRVNRVSCPR